jgi:hypothetical protein
VKKRLRQRPPPAGFSVSRIVSLIRRSIASLFLFAACPTYPVLVTVGRVRGTAEPPPRGGKGYLLCYTEASVASPSRSARQKG